MPSSILGILSRFYSSDPVSRSSPSPTNSQRIALERCVARTHQLIRQLMLQISVVDLKECQCSMPRDFYSDPVVTECGHVFERAVIERLKNQGEACPLCWRSINRLIPIKIHDDVITYSELEGVIPIFTNFKTPALNSYGQLFKYANTSKGYAVIPPIYDLLGEFDKATLSRLYLCLLQMQIGKIPEARKTLEDCRTLIPPDHPIVVGLTLQSSCSADNIAWAMDCAAVQSKIEDRIFIYKQIITHAPTELDAYQHLIPLIKSPHEKRELLLRAADAAHAAQQLELEISFRNEAALLFVSDVVSKYEWANAATIKLPPYSQELQDFLAGDCTIWRGKKRSETHIVVPLFPRLEIDDTQVPLTFETLDQLDKSSGGAGCIYIAGHIPKEALAQQEFLYGVMTKDIIPGSSGMKYNDQIRLLPEGYEAPGVFDAARALLWEHRRSGNRHFSDDSYVYTSCKEVVQRSHLYVGGFDYSGLRVCISHSVYENLGIAGWRTFSL